MSPFARTHTHTHLHPSTHTHTHTPTQCTCPLTHISMKQIKANTPNSLISKQAVPIFLFSHLVKLSPLLQPKERVQSVSVEMSTRHHANWTRVLPIRGTKKNMPVEVGGNEMGFCMWWREADWNYTPATGHAINTLMQTLICTLPSKNLPVDSDTENVLCMHCIWIGKS